MSRSSWSMDPAGWRAQFGRVWLVIMMHHNARHTTLIAPVRR